MKVINGISFEDWAAASANLVAGMPVEEVCKVLGVEQPVWEETANKWGNELGNLMAEDMNYATLYSNIFTNPKVGKFANAGSVNTEDAMTKVPDYDTFSKIFWHQAIAAKHGVDLVSLLKDEYNLNLTEWSMASSHYSNMHKDGQNYDLHTQAEEKWVPHFEKIYGTSNLADDVDF